VHCRPEYQQRYQVGTTTAVTDLQGLVEAGFARQEGGAPTTMYIYLPPAALPQCRKRSFLRLQPLGVFHTRSSDAAYLDLGLPSNPAGRTHSTVQFNGRQAKFFGYSSPILWKKRLSYPSFAADAGATSW